MKRSAIGIFVLLVVYAICVILVVSLGGTLFFFLFDMTKQLPYFFNQVFFPCLEQFTSMIQQHFSFIHFHDLQSIFQALEQVMIWFMGLFSSLFSHIPNILFSFLVFILSTFFLAIDYDDIRQKIIHIFPSELVHYCHRVKEHSLESIMIYVKCQLILMMMTFFVLCIAFSIIRISNPLFYAFVTALLDSLPIIGTGIILIPMVFFYCFKRAYLCTFYIFLIYVFINILKSFLEPKIMNQHMRIPSFILLLSMIVHLHLFGFMGFILSPIHMNLIYSSLE